MCCSEVSCARPGARVPRSPAPGSRSAVTAWPEQATPVHVQASEPSCQSASASALSPRAAAANSSRTPAAGSDGEQRQGQRRVRRRRAAAGPHGAIPCSSQTLPGLDKSACEESRAPSAMTRRANRIVCISRRRRLQPKPGPTQFPECRHKAFQCGRKPAERRSSTGKLAPLAGQAGPSVKRSWTQLQRTQSATGWLWIRLVAKAASRWANLPTTMRGLP
jgi:hypothetical protein